MSLLSDPANTEINNTSRNSRNEDIRSKAHSICKDYLHGAWTLIGQEDMIIHRISGGLSNLLYCCELPSFQPPLGEEPNKVLLRMYGQVRDGAHEATITDSVIFTLLAERKLGPKLYGIFPGGRLEEYMQATPLSSHELANPAISQTIANRMAQVHNLKVPISKEPVFLWQTMKTWVQLWKKWLKDSKVADNSPKSHIAKRLASFDFEQEVEWLRQYIGQNPSPVIFCHNDCQEGNILKHNVSPSSTRPAPHNLNLTLIDFEYCSYNYRSFDIANHFCEWMYDYTLEEYPHFASDLSLWPTEQQQLYFIRAYLRARDSDGGDTSTTSTTKYSAESDGRLTEEEQEILSEIRIHELSSHLFWSLWSAANAPVSAIAFGYWEYALCRLEAYQIRKEKLQGELKLTSSLPC